MTSKITKSDLLEISAIFTWKYQKEVADLLYKNDLMDCLNGFFKSETHLHTQRVSDFSVLIAQYLELKEPEVKMICEIAPFHDFGKLTTPAKILAKPAKLTETEFDIIKEHPKKGFDLLSGLNNKMFDLAAIVAHQHHEKFSGGGYPNNLRGEEIHLYSRIIAVADVLDSLLSKRAYKNPWSKEKVFDFFKKGKGDHFDPKIIDIVLDNFEEFYDYHSNVNFEELDQKIKKKLSPILSCFISEDFTFKNFESA